MAYTEVRKAAQAKVNSYTLMQCEWALRDCHDTLIVGEYAHDSDYGAKLWAEIDACRERIDRIRALALSPKPTFRMFNMPLPSRAAA